MLDQSVFTETIHEVAEIIRTSASPLSEEEILSYFKEMELNGEQKKMVLDFLMTPKEEPEEEPEEVEEDTVSEDTGEDAAEQEECLPESKMFQMYLEELKNLPVYSSKKQEELYRKLLAGDETVISPLCDSWMMRVLEIAKKLAVSAEGFEDVVQEGNLALFLKLTELCGCAEKTDVETELENAVEDAMKKSILELEGDDEDGKAVVGRVALVNEAKKYLAKEQGREATLKELSDYTKLSGEELSNILGLIEKAEAEGKQK